MNILTIIKKIFSKKPSEYDIRKEYAEAKIRYIEARKKMKDLH